METNGKQLRSFATGLTNLTELHHALSQLYLSLRRLVASRNDLLLREMPLLVKMSGGSEISLSMTEREEIIKRIYESGALLYQQIFSHGDKTLRTLVRILEDFDWHGSVPRIKIDSHGIYIPWQLLHPPYLQPDWGRLWGFRYALTVHPQMPNREGRIGGTMFQPLDTIFLQYRGEDSGDSIHRLGGWQVDELKKVLLCEADGMDIINSRDEFKWGVKQKADSFKLLVSFTHTLSGSEAVQTDSGVILVQEPQGARMLFAPDEFITPADFQKLPLAEEHRPLYFSQEPIMILNGCETGTSGQELTSDYSFPGALIELGSRGVLVTEAPIWTHFGFHFGNELIKKIAAGEEMATALRMVRRWYLETTNNPLGLMYSYYGNGSARIARAPCRS